MHLSVLTSFSFYFGTTKVFTGNVPFSNDTSVETMVAIMSGGRPPRPTHDALTDGLWELMQQCWTGDPDERPQISEVLKDLNPSSPPTSPDMSPQLGEFDRLGASPRPGQLESPSQFPPVISDLPIPLSNFRHKPEEYEPSEMSNSTEAFYRCPEGSDSSSSTSNSTERSFHFPRGSDTSSNTFGSTEGFYQCPEESDPSDEYQKLLQELLHHEKLKLYAHGLRKKNVQGIVDVLGEVRSLNIQTHRC